ncbi:hypothetical protein RG903_01935 [Thermithiobacillus tepidarius DSM 3134]|uniref:hypothetical protein n=1 Tax=Thermithiobacillus tepidarius TaxID=929 RepID=UPI00041AAACD|nr:hypothetical protein [Thermithiobacillus tepidarius]
MPLLLAASLHAHTAPKDTVQLSYAWPAHLESQVDFVSRSSKITGKQEESLAMTGSYRMRSVPVAEGLRIDFDEVRVDIQNTGMTAQKLDDFQRALLKLTSVSPSYIVSPAGEYVRTDGLDSLHGRIRSYFDETVQNASGGRELPPAARQVIEGLINSLFSKEQLEAMIAEDWNRSVGAWAGGELARGSVYRTNLTSRVPMLNNAAVPMRTSIRYLGRVPCHAADRAVGCVELEMRSLADSQKLAQAMGPFMARFERLTGSQLTIKSMRVDYRARLVTEPGTLLPHRVESRKVSAMTMVQAGQAQTARQTDELQMTYRYIPATPGR